jgi:hypothetical protein
VHKIVQMTIGGSNSIEAHDLPMSAKFTDYEVLQIIMKLSRGSVRTVVSFQAYKDDLDRLLTSASAHGIAGSQATGWGWLSGLQVPGTAGSNIGKHWAGVVSKSMFLRYP